MSLRIAPPPEPHAPHETKPAAPHHAEHPHATTDVNRTEFTPDAHVEAAKATVTKLFAAIGHGEPSKVMHDLAPLLQPHTLWLVPAGNALSDTNHGAVKPSTFAPREDGQPRVAYQGPAGVQEYVSRLFNLSGQGEGNQGVANAKFHPMLRELGQAHTLPNGTVQITVHAEATALRGDIFLDGHPEKNGGPNHDQPAPDGKIHGVGKYDLKVTLSADGKHILQLETEPHDVKLFNGFWGDKPITLPKG